MYDQYRHSQAGEYTLTPELEAMIDGHGQRSEVMRETKPLGIPDDNIKTVNTQPVFLVNDSGNWGLTNDPKKVLPRIICTRPIILDRFDLAEYSIRYHHYPSLLRVFDLIRRIASIGRPAPGTRFMLSVEGHTDKTGNEAGNAGLSLNRAFEAIRFLKESFGGTLPIDYSVAGLGATRPISATDAARNRRVEIIICQIRIPVPARPPIIASR